MNAHTIIPIPSYKSEILARLPRIIELSQTHCIADVAREIGFDSRQFSCAIQKPWFRALRISFAKIHRNGSKAGSGLFGTEEKQQRLRDDVAAVEARRLEKVA